MVDRLHRRAACFLLGFIPLQILFPVLLSLAVFTVKYEQKKLIASGGYGRPPMTTLTVKITDPTLQFLSDEEFSYKGTLYDIESISIVNDEYAIRCLPDKKELSLERLISGYVNNTDGSHILPFFFLFFEAPGSWHPSPQNVEKPFYSIKVYEPSAGHFDQLSPPPDSITA
jgi:hypothetical protein